MQANLQGPANLAFLVGRQMIAHGTVCMCAVGCGSCVCVCGAVFSATWWRCWCVCGWQPTPPPHPFLLAFQRQRQMSGCSTAPRPVAYRRAESSMSAPVGENVLHDSTHRCFLRWAPGTMWSAVLCYARAYNTSIISLPRRWAPFQSQHADDAPPGPACLQSVPRRADVPGICGLEGGHERDGAVAGQGARRPQHFRWFQIHAQEPRYNCVP